MLSTLDMIATVICEHIYMDAATNLKYFRNWLNKYDVLKIEFAQIAESKNMLRGHASRSLPSHSKIVIEKANNDSSPEEHKKSITARPWNHDLVFQYRWSQQTF